MDATAIVDDRLCPGTFAKVCASRSLEMGFLGELTVFSMGWPVRSAEALVMRGTMSGLAVDAGTALALNAGFPFALSLEGLPLIVDGFVAFDGAYPSSRWVRASDSMISARTASYWLDPFSGGRSDTGKGGEDAKRAAI